MCFGGLVAMEIARRLTARGEQVGFLGFLDTYPHPRFWPPWVRFDYLVLRRIRETWTALRTAPRGTLAAQVAARAAALRRKLAAAANARQPTEAANARSSVVNMPAGLPPAVKAVFEGGVSALEGYQPRPYPGKVSYLMCGYHTYLPHGPAAVWRRLVGSLEVQCGPRSYDPDGPTNAEYVAHWLSERITDAPAPAPAERRGASNAGRVNYSPSSAASV